MKNIFRLSIVFLLVSIMFFVSCSDSIYSGKKWKAKLFSVRYENQYQGGQNYYNGMVIDVEIEYIGAGEKIPAPAVYLLEENNSKKRAVMVQTHKKDPASDMVIRSWLGDEGTKFDFKTGDKISKNPLTYLWKTPESGGTYKLVIGDISPITIGY